MAKKNTKKTELETEEFESKNPDSYNNINVLEEDDFETSDNAEIDEVYDEEDAEFIDDKEDDFETSDHTEIDEEDAIETSDNTDIDEEDEEPLVITGTVTTRLNIRENDTGSPETAIVSIVEAGEEITVYPEEGNPTFFKVKTKNGIEGYAMRRYIILDAE